MAMAVAREQIAGDGDGAHVYFLRVARPLSVVSSQSFSVLLSTRTSVHVLQAACCAKGRAAVFCGRLPSALREGMRNLLYYVIIIVPRDRSPPLLGGVSQNFVVL